jgi:hypothetical protein
MSIRVRPLLPRDAAKLGALNARVNPRVGPTTGWRSPAAYASYALEMLFRNPWVDPEVPSWVAEENERLVGFLGVMPRRMRFGARAIRVAVSCQLMVDPEKRASFVALELLRRLFAGPQDLTVADGADDAARGLWETSGGISSALHSLHWVRLLRPAQGLLKLAGNRVRGLSAVANPLAALVDACMARLAPLKPQPGLREEPLDAAMLCSLLQEQRSFALRPDYDVASLEWLLAQAAAKRGHGKLQSCIVHDRAGRIIGWFLYYLNGAVSQVLQLGARRGCLSMLLEQLAHHARSRGARALEGRMEPSLAAALRGKQVLIQNRAVSTLLHARDQSLLVPFLRGDAFFSRLEGEWWTRFAGEPEAVAPLTRGVARSAGGFGFPWRKPRLADSQP